MTSSRRAKEGMGHRHKIRWWLKITKHRHDWARSRRMRYENTQSQREDITKVERESEERSERLWKAEKYSKEETRDMRKERFIRKAETRISRAVQNHINVRGGTPGYLSTFPPLKEEIRPWDTTPDPQTNVFVLHPRHQRNHPNGSYGTPGS